MGPTRREATIGHPAPFAAWVWRVSAGGGGLEKGDTMRRDAFVRHRTEAGLPARLRPVLAEPFGQPALAAMLARLATGS
jgi:hypothetical protein